MKKNQAYLWLVSMSERNLIQIQIKIQIADFNLYLFDNG